MTIDLNLLPRWLEAEVEPKHLDHMNHMNVMWYTHFFDKAIWHWYESFDFGASYHTQSGWGSFALETHTRYLSELRVGDRLGVHIRMLARNAKLFHYIMYMQRLSDGALSATSELLGIHIDMSTRRSAPLPEHIGAYFDGLIAEHAALAWDAGASGVIKIR